MGAATRASATAGIASSSSRGGLVRDSLGSSGLVEVKPVEMRFSSNEAAWAELERDYFDRREVEVGLHRGTKRSQPLWAKEA